MVSLGSGCGCDRLLRAARSLPGTNRRLPWSPPRRVSVACRGQAPAAVRPQVMELPCRRRRGRGRRASCRAVSARSTSARASTAASSGRRGSGSDSREHTMLPSGPCEMHSIGAIEPSSASTTSAIVISRGRAREHVAAARAAPAVDEPGLAQPRHQVLEVGQRQPVALGDLRERHDGLLAVGALAARCARATITRTPYSALVENIIARIPTWGVGYQAVARRHSRREELARLSEVRRCRLCGLKLAHVVCEPFRCELFEREARRARRRLLSSSSTKAPRS